MAKTQKNTRCPLQRECERTCTHIGAELNCDYYQNNGIGDNSIPDQEELRNQLEALKSQMDFEDKIAALPDEEEESSSTNKLVYIPIDELYPHPDNPRKDLGDLTELADSIKAKGIMQNLTVVPGHKLTDEEWKALSKQYDESPSEELRVIMNSRKSDAGYTVVIGHRRTEAAKLAGLTELPCIIADMTPAEQIQTMLLENMQRSDLTVYEQAQGFQMMMDFGDTVDTIAEKTGFSASTVRRRLKMAELDQETLKKVSKRQLTLMDFDRLSEIKDIKTRNKVLAAMGTNNFENEINKAFASQNEEEQKEKWLKVLAEKGIEEIPESEVFAGKYTHVAQFRLDTTDPLVLDDLIEIDVKYFYAIAYTYWVYIRKEKVITKEDEESEAEKERINAERRARDEALEAAAIRAFECRKRFIKAATNATAKKYIKEIISYTVCHAWTPNIYGCFDRELYATIIGDIKIPAGPLNYALVQLETENTPEKALLCYAYALWNDSARNAYYDYQSIHRENAKLDALYALLEKLGYEMSDEEIALRDGTSELFAKPETEDEDDFDEDESVEAEIIEDDDSADEDETSDEDAERDELLEKLSIEYGGETDDE